MKTVLRVWVHDSVLRFSSDESVQPPRKSSSSQCGAPERTNSANDLQQQVAKSPSRNKVSLQQQLQQIDNRHRAKSFFTLSGDSSASPGSRNYADCSKSLDGNLPSTSLDKLRKGRRKTDVTATATKSPRSVVSDFSTLNNKNFNKSNGNMNNNNSSNHSRTSTTAFMQRKAVWNWIECNMRQSDDGSILIERLDVANSNNKDKNVDEDNDDSRKNSVIEQISLPISMLNHQVLMSNEYPTLEDDDDNNGEKRALYPDDLTTLTHLHEPAIVECLMHRYYNPNEPLVYTSTGPVLIALNPFQTLENLYSRTTMEEYWTKAELGQDKQKLRPHVFAIADQAFRGMMRALEIDMHHSNNINSNTNVDGVSAMRSCCDQTVLVSGESGAGKTVTTKYVMKYLTALSQRASYDKNADSKASSANNSNNKNNNKQDTTSIEAQVLQSNPILESFGNARTIRNDNSSRFGKFIAMQFTRAGKLVGTKIDTYLLEKVRLIKQNVGERNYHVFFELLSGSLNQKELEMYQLKEFNTPDDFRILSNGIYDRRDGVKDVDTFSELRQAMKTMGFKIQEEQQVFGLLAAILHASNLSFIQIEEESSLVMEDPSIASACQLLGVSATSLSDALCFFTVVIGGEPFRRAQPLDKSAKGLEALMKAVYGALFTWLVRRINDQIGFKGGTEQTGSESYSHPASVIGVLDIFGFESFEINSFEQLCINYCNEKLQQQFNQFVLKNEQAEYKKEGIQWEFIDFSENLDVLELIEDNRNGVLRILDDQGKIPGQNDKTFALDLYTRCNGKPRFQASKNQRGFLKFGIEHYAGVVEYTTDGFVEKNKDELPKESCELLKNSSNSFLQCLADIIGGSVHISDEVSSKAQNKSNRQGTNSSNASRVAAHFRRQLEDLRSKIEKTAPHYIRCIKPNDKLVSETFDRAVVAEQLRCGGILEAVRVTRAGFTQHYLHSEFIVRYSYFARKELQLYNSELREGSEKDPSRQCRLVIEAVDKKLRDMELSKTNESKLSQQSQSAHVLMQCGKTKVFLRHHAFEVLEQLRVNEQGKAATKINSLFRRFLSRIAYLKVRDQFREELVERGLTFEDWYRERHNPRKITNASISDSSNLVNYQTGRTRRTSDDLARKAEEERSRAKMKAIIHNNKNSTSTSKWVKRKGFWVLRGLENEENNKSLDEHSPDKSKGMVRSNWKGKM